MADSINPNNKNQSANFLPRFYRTDSNKKFTQATVDQLIQNGTVKKINGFIGRQNAKASTADDIFINAVTPNRQNYQLEPGLVVKDTLDNVTFFKDYQDYINQLTVFGSNTKNHSVVNEQEFYSWDPHIDWDKFVNFQNYYWLPFGPDVIKVAGQQQAITSTYTVTLESEGDSYEYIFTPNGITRNPTLTLFKGQTYTFDIASPGNPFSIKTQRTAGTLDRYQPYGITNFAVEQGTITFTIPHDAPSVLYYVSESDINLGGVIHVKTIDENTRINVDTEISGKKSYTLPNGTPLSNGMKVKFIGNVSPEKYASGEFYVEGIGAEINLIKESDLELISAYTTSESVLFDTTPFDNLPFSDATAFAGTRDYIIINRASPDRNPWTRYNRWFHKDVINASATYNNKVPNLDQTARAVRPIIEFEAGLKLFNFGLTATIDVDLIDNYTTDVFSTIEGAFGYNVDGTPLVNGHRILFTADTDEFVKNKIYRVEFIDVQRLNSGSRQIHLVLEEEPIDYQVAIIKQGVINQGQSYWFNGSTWIKGQQKTSLNQAPLFDIVDNNKVSYGDTSIYEGSTFVGTKLFSYKVGSGTSDTNLGFALSYKNINNIGDIVFNFNILTDTFRYKQLVDVITVNTDIGFLTRISPETRIISYTNGWKKSEATEYQAGVRIYKNTYKTVSSKQVQILNNFDIDTFDNKDDLGDLVVKVYINGIRLDKEFWDVVPGPVYKKVVLTTNIKPADVLTIKTFARQPINQNGYYEVPLNLQNNPMNNQITEFTLGEVIDHVGSIVDNLNNFNGSYPGAGNLRDLGNTTAYGTKFVQHSGPLGLSLYHITSQENNIIKALDESKEDYNKFKRNFISIIDTIGIHDTNPITQVNLILKEINKDVPKTSAYYFSDMVGSGANIYNSYTVIDYRIKTYPLSAVFNLDELSNKAVYVYLNGTQMLFDKDYTFNDQGYIEIIDSVNLQNDDTITVYEYENTDGCFIPQTPTKLGIWPKYEPKIFVDTSLITPRTMIQGHDGSLVLSYGDYRDDLILELEKRIFNNVKVKYDTTIFDIHDFDPSYVRTTNYSLADFNETLAPQFFKWTGLVNKDFTKPLSYDKNNPLTYNHKGYAAPDGKQIPGYWRGVYRWMLDTDRPNNAPWEMLGFTLEPVWWTSVYGPAPYTSDNKILWQDLSEGLVKEPGKPVVQLTKYVRPFLLDHIPVDENGNIISPIDAGIANGSGIENNADYVFGDVSPVESAWRRSSYYPFGFLSTILLLSPAKVIGLILDRSRIIRNLTGQLVYKDTGLRISPASVVLPSIYSSTSRVQTAGLINYIVDYILSDNLRSYNAFQYNLKNINPQLSYRLGAFTSKEKFNFLLDSKSATSTGGIFIPQEDFDVILNISSPVKKITYSGVIITRLPNGYDIKGYSKTQPYFKYYPYLKDGPTINVGGISEEFSSWTANQQYASGKIVKYNNRYYRANSTHLTIDVFEPQFYQALASLPVAGGREATFRTVWDRTTVITIPYSTKFRTIQEVVDFLLGYGEYLKDQGFIFDNFNTTLEAVTNWETSAKEFLFWTTQNWSSSQDKWRDWLPNVETKYQEIIKYNGEYYQAIRLSPGSSIFIDDDFEKLDGLSTVGSSVISLSPAAYSVNFSVPYTVVDDIKSAFNGYEIFKVDGSPIAPTFLNSYRSDNAVSYTPDGTDGIFGVSFYLVQKEQVILLKNTTMFNDTIYNPESGYRQERITVSSYVSTGWYGSFDAPGFIFDQAKVQEWAQWTDYALGDIVKYKEFYYSAKSQVPGTAEFNDVSWIKLAGKPKPALLPNWSYKAEQFNDFYSLDSDNFDVGQQKMAQHLIGYQKRQYLENIIKDDVSEFKFYQGMIIEKGTQNVLNKLFDVLSAEGEESLKFHEEWAVRVGQYGASSAFENIEFILDESQFKNNPQGFELVTSIDPELSDFIIRQTFNDVYLKPVGYNNNPWATVKNYNPYLRSPGYVRANEVSAVLKTIEDIANEDTANINNGDYVWVGFAPKPKDWDVFRYTPASFEVVNATYVVADQEVILEINKLATLMPGTYLGIEHVSFNGFYKVKSSILNTIILEYTQPDWQEFVPGTSVQVFILESKRVGSIDLADTVFTKKINTGELLWTDNSGDGLWATWEYNPVYQKTQLKSQAPTKGLGFGQTISLNKAGSVAAVSTNTGEISIFSKDNPSVPWVQKQTIAKPVISDNEKIWNSITVYSVNDIVFYINSWYVPTQTVPLNTPPATNLDYWDRVYYSDITAMSSDGTWLAVASPTASNVLTNEDGTVGRLGTPSELTKQGVVSIYKRDSNGVYSLVNTFVSPDPTDNELFGSALSFGNSVLFVSAIGNDNQTGRVYQFTYGQTVYGTALYNPIGSLDTVIKVTTTAGVAPGMEVVGAGFTRGQVVEEVQSPTLLKLSAAPDSEPSGRLKFVITDWSYEDLFGFSMGETVGSQFGFSLDVSNDSSTLVVSAPQDKKVFVYQIISGAMPIHDQTITGDDLEFGYSLTISDNADYVGISSILADNTKVDQGAVYIYKKSNDEYTITQSLTNIAPEDAGYFGSKISFMNNYNTLVVYSAAANTSVATTFDASETIFDDKLTSFSTQHKDSGRVDVYDRYNNNWVFSESLPMDNTADDRYGYSVAIGANHVFVGAPSAIDRTKAAGVIYEYSKYENRYSWEILHKEIKKVDLTKIKSAFLYNKETNKLITYLDVIDPVQGKIPGISEQEIKYKTFYDPATYSVGNSAVNVDDGMAWTKEHVGALWWDLSTVKFLDSHDNDTVYRNSSWNTLFPGSSIDIYEWVESSLLPAGWNAQADTDTGITLGISGTTLYDNSVYSVEKKYDNVSKSFRNTYFYWVKNKATVPNIATRHISAQDVSELIANPRGQGYKFLAITGTNSFSLVNVSPLLEDNNVVLSVQYWIADHQNQSVHSQWKIISRNPTTILPQSIELKWFDSLCGKDEQGRLVPDPVLAPKIKYGVENRPRQSMFVNRFEALKQLFEKVNIGLSTEQIIGQKNISLLESHDLEPNINLGLYDVVFDTDAELRFANVGRFKIAELIPIIVNGAITGVTIVSKGNGYVNAPYVDISGNGVGAKIKAIINTRGQVTGVTVITSGEGYTDATIMTLRSYCALVHSDSQALGTWSIYSYDLSTFQWSRIRSQSYDTRKYWNYIDWYATGYNAYSLVNYSVQTFVELNAVETSIGQLVKINSTSEGTWLLLRKYADSMSVDWTQSYEIVGVQNGTIQFNSSLYTFTNTSYGYDGSVYDGNIFDNSASIELRNILTCLKNNILIDTLRQQYLDLFFSSVKYAFVEQNYIDWIFKTSFVKAQHNVGELKQPITYSSDNLEDFESYVSEVKPYRTKVREYVSSYSKTDKSQLSITDFDIQPVYYDGALQVIDARVIDDVIQVEQNALIQEYPWKHWVDNVGYTVTEIKLVDGGSGYRMEPVVRFSNLSGSGVSARALIANGKVNRIILLTKGSGYLKAPVVLIEGGLAEGGVSATAVAIIGDSLVRSNLIKIKFDRLTQNYFITQLEETETFVGTGSRLQFPLKWAPDVRIGKAVVTVNGVSVLRDDYKLKIVKSTARGYTSYAGSITFDKAIEKNIVVVVNYIKDWSLLNAADRIQYFYNPSSGDIGKDLSQLMTGVDYGGVIINGLSLEETEGWDSVPFNNDKWDSVDPTFDDYIVTVAANTHSFTLPYIPEAGTIINLYYIKQYSVEYVSNGVILDYQYDPHATSLAVYVDYTITTTASNIKGNTTLIIPNTSVVKEGDVVTTALSGVFSYGTRVASIVNGTTLKLDQILFDDIAIGTNITFRKPLVKNIDYTINVIGLLTLTEAATNNSTIIITSPLDSIRLDDPEYSSVSLGNWLPSNSYIVGNVVTVKTNRYVCKTVHTSSQDFLTDTSSKWRLITPTAIIDTFVGNDEDDTITINGSYQVNAGDKFILRKNTSDGSIKPQENDYDTALVGGDLVYQSATGLRAEDIIVDGDGFVTPTSSPATEEVVPGHVFDAVSIKVYDRPTTGSANIKVSNYVADGITYEFNIGQQINSSQAVIVKVDNEIKDVRRTILTPPPPTTIGDYDVNFVNGKIIFNVAPAAKQIVTIYSFGFSGTNILDLDYFVGNGTTQEFITKAPWLSDLTSLVYIDGVPTSVELFETDLSYESNKRTGLRFNVPPPANSIINFIVVSGIEQTFAITTTEKIATDGRENLGPLPLSTPLGTSTYSLENKIGDSKPIESNMIVRVNQEILPAANNSYYKIGGKNGQQLTYLIDENKFKPYTLNITDIVVYVSDVMLRLGPDFTIDLSVINVKINRRVRDLYLGQTLVVSIVPNRDNLGQSYIYLPGVNNNQPRIVFNQVYTESDTVEVVSSYKHDVLDIQRTTLTATTDIVATPNTLEYYNYVGVTNGVIKLDRAVIDERYVWVTKNNTLLTPSIDFKLTSDKQFVKLADEPDMGDEISIMTYSNNVLVSGIAYMQFKDMLNRTHFKRLSANKQTQLLRDLKYNDVEIFLIDATNFDLPNKLNNKPGVVEIRGERIEYFEITGNILRQLRRGTLGTSTPLVHNAGAFAQDIGPGETIPYADTLTIDNVISNGTNTVNLTFVPGNFDTTWEYLGTSMSLSKSLELAKSAVEVFAGGIRLKKNPYKVYSVDVHPESPEGDVEFDEEFTVNNITKTVELTAPVAFGTRVTVAKRTGIAWDSTRNILYTDNKVAGFLKAEPGIWYTSMKQISTVTPTITTSFDSTSTGFDSTTITFDQG
jgi:hypothetical protein